MAQYYGVQRSDEYLAHYGVRGMKWGVRKAIQHPVSYLRAKHKLSKLTDEQKQMKKYAQKAMSKTDKLSQKLQAAREDDKSSFLMKRLKIARRKAAYKRSRRKLMDAVSTYSDSLNKYQRRRLRNRMIRI